METINYDTMHQITDILSMLNHDYQYEYPQFTFTIGTLQRLGRYLDYDTDTVKSIVEAMILDAHFNFAVEPQSENIIHRIDDSHQMTRLWDYEQLATFINAIIDKWQLSARV